MILGANGEPVLARRGRQPLRHSPRGEDTVPLEAQVPVQAARVVLLDHEAQPLHLARPRQPIRLRGALERALAAVLAQRLVWRGAHRPR